METIHTNIADDVADTLFIPLYMRCLETRRQDAIIRDPDACRIVESLDYDFSKYDKAVRSQLGVCLRVQYFDAVTRKFIESSDDPVVVNMGCGLDSRANRVGMPKGVFYNLDLPEVMELRDRLLPPDERNVSVHRSMFDPAWMREIREKHPDSSVLVLSEGVLMYFPEDRIRPLIEQVAEVLAPGELLFDACTGFGCKLSSRHDSLKHTKARFQWALDEDDRLERWSPNLFLNSVNYYMDKESMRWDFVSRIMARIPPCARAFRMLHYQMAPARA